jgi:UDP:flavonoid glycosyltransferase YjiC (YdhE family)
MRWLSTALAPVSFFSVSDFPALPPRPGLVRALTSRPWMARPFLALAKKLTEGWARPVRELRAARGLPDAGHPMFEGQFSPFGTLALFSKVIASPQPDWPPRTTTTGFVSYNRPAPLPAAVDKFLEGEPPIVFTLGSSAVGAPGGFYDESIAAARALRRRALLMIRSDVGSATSTPLPDDVIAIDYAPHESIFPRAAAIVHHGGVGTLGQALRSGRPMLVVPHAHDQPDNGARVARLGVARVIDARQYRASAVVRALDALISDPRYEKRAADAAAIVRSERGADAAVDVIAEVLER